jgi:hypothetical protein
MDIQDSTDDLVGDSFLKPGLSIDAEQAHLGGWGDGTDRKVAGMADRPDPPRWPKGLPVMTAGDIVSTPPRLQKAAAKVPARQKFCFASGDCRLDTSRTSDLKLGEQIILVGRCRETASQHFQVWP